MRLSYLMSIPAVLGAIIGLALLDGISLDVVAVSGVLTSFVFGLLTIRLLMRVAARVAFWGFCVLIGVLSFLPLVVDAL